MNFLILINSAPGYKYFYFRLGKSLERSGHQVRYAIDAARSRYIEPLPELDSSSKAIFFDEFFRGNYNEPLGEALFDVTWGDYFFSEFDRFFTHDFNLKRPKDYWVKVRYCLDRFFDKVLLQENIDCVIYENVSNSYAFAAYQAAKRNGSTYLGLIASRLPGRFEIQASIIDHQVDAIDKLADGDFTHEDYAWLNDYREAIINVSPDYMKYNGLDKINLRRLLSLRKIKQAYRLIKSFWLADYYYDYQFGNPLQVFRKGLLINIKRSISARVSRRYFEKDADVALFSEKESFYVYPMHFHPESSTSVLAPLYTNELNNIINISNNLPFGELLYVKDHLSAYGLQSPSFYRKVAAIPNVRLVSPFFNIKKLILESKGVITINSTAGFESIVLGRPVYVLGRVFYERFPNVYRLSNFNDLRDTLGAQWQESADKYIMAYYKYTLPGDVRISRALESDNIFFDELAVKLIDKANIQHAGSA